MRKIKLSHKLIFMIAFPLILGVSGWLYAMGILNVANSYVLISAVLLLFFAYLAFAFYFLPKLTRGILNIEKAVNSLKHGQLEEKFDEKGLPETNNICNTLNNLRDDISRQTSFAEQLKIENFEIAYTPRHDHDLLGKALLGIKENLITVHQADEQRNWTSEGLAKFVKVLQSTKNLKDLSNEIIINLVRTIHANQGTVFLLDKDETGKECLEMQACYAFNRTKHITQKIFPGEGLIGQVFLEKETRYLKEVPEHFVRITSGLGESNPRYVLIVPLKTNETVVGVVELASFKEFTKHQTDFVEKIGESIAHTVSSFKVAENTRKLLDESNAHAEQMRAQEEELRQNQEELQATQEEISRKYDTLFKQLGEVNHQSRFDQLKSINSTKKRNVEYYFDIIRNQISTFSEDLMIIEALRGFKAAFYQIGKDVSDDQLPIISESVKEYYLSEFFPKLNDHYTQQAEVDEYIPKELRTLQLQHSYISNNPHPTGSKSLLDDVNDGSEYSRVHALYHPILRNFLEKFGYYDIFLIDAETGDMLYSVFKEVDFATNLKSGLYHTTNFGKVVKQAMESTDKNFVKLIDFEPYDPSYHAPASFIASAIYDGEQKVGVLVFQMPINKINQILTGNGKWEEDGLGESGETFIVGNDYKLRSISRDLIQNPDAHLQSLRKLMYGETILQQIKKMETNILLEEIKQDSVAKAISGLMGTQMEKNAQGVDVLTAFAPVKIEDVHWIVMSTMKESEASRRINNLREGNT